MKEFALKIGSECNNACIFCKAREEKFHQDFAFIAGELWKARKAPFDAVRITGLEPTVHPHFLQILEAAKKLNFKRIVVDSNARMFSYSDFAGKAAATGLSEVQALLPHASASGYRSVTGVGEGFGQCVKGIKNLLALNSVEVSARIPICEENIHVLSDIVELAASIGMRKAKAYFPREYFPANAPFDSRSFERQLERSFQVAKECGLAFEFNRGSRIFQRRTEMDERTAVSFYPTSYVGRNGCPVILDALIRPTFKCNQICNFCWIDPSSPDPPVERIESEIANIVKSRIPQLAFSGGEPTLDPNLPRHIAAAKNGGVRQVEIHTNAVLLVDGGLCDRLRDADLDTAYCTMLATTAAVSDSITRTEGTFKKTVQGISNLILRGVNVVAHTVIMGHNYKLMPDLVKFIDTQFTCGDFKVPMNFSFVAPKDRRAMEKGIVPRFSEAMPYLEAALAECEARGIPFSSGEGLKGGPPCTMPNREKYMKHRAPSNRNLAGGEFVKKDSCESCLCDDACFGVRRHYADHYGMDEFEPLTEIKNKGRKSAAPRRR